MGVEALTVGTGYSGSTFSIRSGPRQVFFRVTVAGPKYCAASFILNTRLLCIFMGRLMLRVEKASAMVRVVLSSVYSNQLSTLPKLPLAYSIFSTFTAS